MIPGSEGATPAAPELLQALAISQFMVNINIKYKNSYATKLRTSDMVDKFGLSVL